MSRLHRARYKARIKIVARRKNLQEVITTVLLRIMRLHCITAATPNRLRPKTKLPHKCGSLAGATRFEHATDGFGDRNSTVELRPFALISYHLSADKSIIFGVFMKNKIKIAFIGCGKLARAMIESMTNRASVSVLKSNGYVFSITASSRS